MEGPLKTPDEAVRFLGLDRQGLRAPREALRWLCRTGKLKYARVGRYVRFREEWLQELVNTNTVRREAVDSPHEERETQR